MILLSLFSLSLVRAAEPPPPPIEAAATAEVQRTMERLRLPDTPAPYFLSYDVVQGEVVTAVSAFGALIEANRQPIRTLRTEVRVGDYTTDSSGVSALSGPDAVDSRQLPIDDVPVALEREFWLATDTSYKAAVEQLSRKQAARQGADQDYPPDFSLAPTVSIPPVPRAPVAALAAVEALSTQLSGVLRGVSGLESGVVQVRDWQGERGIFTSEGTHAWVRSGYVIVRATASLRLADGTSLRDSRSWVAPTFDALPPASEMEAAVREMAAWLTGLRDAPVEEDYLGPVLFTGDAAAELFSQLLAPELAGTPPLQDEDPSAPSYLPSARIGRRLLPPGWSVVDDPTLRDGRMGTYALDHEAVAPSRVALVQDGVVQAVLMSRAPRDAQSQSTGHGRALGTDRRAAMPGAVVVSPAKSRSARRLERAALRYAAAAGRDYVLVVQHIEPLALGQGLDWAISGERPLPGVSTPLEVYRLYRDGRRVPVRSLSFSGVDRRVLRGVVMAGAMNPPVAIMDGPPGPSRYLIGELGGIPTSWQAPDVLIDELELDGGGGGEPRVLPAATP